MSRGNKQITEVVKTKVNSKTIIKQGNPLLLSLTLLFGSNDYYPWSFSFYINWEISRCIYTSCPRLFSAVDRNGNSLITSVNAAELYTCEISLLYF